jgi:hypothetical protein
MKIKITSTAEHDRHEAEVRFVANVDGTQTSITLTDHALFLISEALAISSHDPLVIYAASGNLLNQVVLEAIRARGDIQSTYLITHQDVLRVTGTQDHLPHVPRKWDAASSRIK